MITATDIKEKIEEYNINLVESQRKKIEILVNTEVTNLFEKIAKENKNRIINLNEFAFWFEEELFKEIKIELSKLGFNTESYFVDDAKYKAIKPYTGKKSKGKVTFITININNK